MGMIEEFKKFALRGNVLDMAVGIIIGGAFGGVVKSLVNDVIMPPIGLLTGGVDFKDKLIELQPAAEEALNEAGEVITPAASAVNLTYGLFLNTIINFLIVAFAVFLLVKAINKAQDAFDQDEPEAEAPKEPPEEIQLLREIRDSLKNA